MTASSLLPADHYRLSVVTSPPSAKELFNRFMGIDVLFHPETEWHVPDAWREAADADGERVFFPKRFERPMYAHAVLDWNGLNGYRPATYVETIRFAMAEPQAVLAATKRVGPFPFAEHARFLLVRMAA